MAAIVNERDLILQATAPRLEPISLPNNVEIDIDNVLGAGALAKLDFVDANTQVTNLGDLAYADTILANQIGAGTLPVGVVYAGEINADQVNAGTFTGLTFRTTASTSGEQVVISHATNDIRVRVGGTVRVRLGGDGTNGYLTINKGAVLTPGIYAESTGGAAAIYATTSGGTEAIGGNASGGAVGVAGHASGTGPGVRASNSDNGVALDARAISSSSGSTANHGIRGQNTRLGTSGLVGASNGYAFYDEAGGYGPFTGAHDAVVPNGFVAAPGDIMVDGEIVRTRGVSDVLMTAALSAASEQQGAIGVLVGIIGPMSEVRPAAMMEGIDPETGLPCMCDEWEEYADTHQVVKINAVGEGLINVCGRNGNLSKGDLIVCSDMPGKGQKQDDGIIRNTTVARSRVDVIFDYPDEVKLVPCIYLCG